MSVEGSLHGCAFYDRKGRVPEPLRAIERTAVTGFPAKALSGMLDDFPAICNT